MSRSVSTKQLCIRAMDERGLYRRVELFLEAIHRQRGRVVDIAWIDDPPHPPRAITIRYALPAVSPACDARGSLD